TLREQDVAGIAEAHYPLSDVDRGSGNVRSIIYIDNAANRPAVDTHSQWQLRKISQCFADLQCALHGSLRTIGENKHHSVTGGQPEKFTSCFCRPELVSALYNSIEDLERFALLVDQEFGITHGIDEQNVGNLQLDFRFDLGGHTAWSLAPLSSLSRPSRH